MTELVEVVCCNSTAEDGRHFIDHDFSWIGLELSEHRYNFSGELMNRVDHVA